MENPSQKDDDENSLEFKQETTDPTTSVTPTDSSAKPEASSIVVGDKKASNGNDPKTPKPKKHILPPKISNFIRKIDVYLLVLALVIIVAAIAIYVATNNNQKNTSANSQQLSQSTINQLNNNDVNVGGAQQTLDIESNSVFAGSVVIKSNLQVAGQLTLGGALNVSGLNVSGTSTMDQVNASGLSVSGTSTLGGSLTVKQGITDDGGASFGGNVSAPEISVSTLNLNGDIQLSHHITTNGSIPTARSGSALGGGGTTSISGTDTAGTIDVNIGDNPSSGCFVSVSFANNFANSPHVVVTPVQTGSAAPPNTNFYITKSTTGFSICGDISSSGGTSFGFDYVTVD
jgi:cytoskeletal protein CcmA (bactofilin family)